MEFFGKRNINYKAAAIGGVAIGGSDWLGLGAAISGSGKGKQGTELCGAKPSCISLSKNSQCAKKNEAYQECVRQSLNVISQSNQTAAEIAKNQQQQADMQRTQANKTRNLVIVGMVLFTVLVVTSVYLITKSKKDK